GRYRPSSGELLPVRGGRRRRGGWRPRALPWSAVPRRLGARGGRARGRPRRSQLARRLRPRALGERPFDRRLHARGARGDASSARPRAGRGGRRGPRFRRAPGTPRRLAARELRRPPRLRALGPAPDHGPRGGRAMTTALVPRLLAAVQEAAPEAAAHGEAA